MSKFKLNIDCLKYIKNLDKIVLKTLNSIKIKEENNIKQELKKLNIDADVTTTIKKNCIEFKISEKHSVFKDTPNKSIDNIKKQLNIPIELVNEEVKLKITDKTIKKILQRATERAQNELNKNLRKMF